MVKIQALFGSIDATELLLLRNGQEEKPTHFKQLPWLSGGVQDRELSY